MPDLLDFIDRDCHTHDPQTSREAGTLGLLLFRRGPQTGLREVLFNGDFDFRCQAPSAGFGQLVQLLKQCFGQLVRHLPAFGFLCHAEHRNYPLR